MTIYISEELTTNGISNQFITDGLVQGVIFPNSIVFAISPN